MERKLQERMVGAGVLVLALVLVVPLLLDGRPDDPLDVDSVPGQRSDEIRTHTFRLDEPVSSAPPSARRPAATARATQPEIATVPSTSPQPPAIAAELAAPASPPVRALPVEPAAPTSSPALPVAPPPQPAVAPRTKSGPAPATGDWVVQVGTFGQKSNAERLAGSLRQKGFDAFLSATTRDGKTLYRVRVGPGASRDAAADLAARLAAAGQTGQVVAQ